MTMPRRTLLALCAAVLAVGLAPVAEAKIVDTEAAMTELVIGKADAPVEMIEYASLSCPACEHFHSAVYPIIKKEYIDTGKVKFIFRDFPTNSPGLAAAMIARCAGPERHEGMVDIFFDTQKQWGHAENPLQALGMVARMAGLGPNDVDQCIRNSTLMNAINEKARKANEELGVAATPTIFVAGKEVEHAQDVDKLKAVIDAALKAAQ
ncbi:DsbA family protein [Thalassospiraceae bacterium LMO-JJ14]|nr:DsbA family protein [Thalassospiraceae bacterium LMO-JJ14]